MDVEANLNLFVPATSAALHLCYVQPTDVFFPRVFVLYQPCKYEYTGSYFFWYFLLFCTWFEICLSVHAACTISQVGGLNCYRFSCFVWQQLNDKIVQFLQLNIAWSLIDPKDFEQTNSQIPRVQRYLWRCSYFQFQMIALRVVCRGENKYIII